MILWHEMDQSYSRRLRSRKLFPKIPNSGGQNTINKINHEEHEEHEVIKQWLGCAPHYLRDLRKLRGKASLGAACAVELRTRGFFMEGHFVGLLNYM